jgi:cytochrome o ubiquinol oxidase operon protein cyoD
MSKQAVIASRHRSGGRGSLQTYVIGFGISIVLTLLAYALVTQSTYTLSKGFVIATIMILAITQLIVQLQFFIHLGNESKPRWNKLMFIFMVIVVFIVVAGTLWIMNNLNYHVMSPSETNTYIMEDEGISR